MRRARRRSSANRSPGRGGAMCRAHHGTLPRGQSLVTYAAMDLPTGSASRRAAWCAAWLLLASVVLTVCGASVGSTGFDSVLGKHGDPVAWQIVWDIRLARTLGAWLAGALVGLWGEGALGLSLHRGAGPYLLGSASGAALGGAVAMALFGVSPVAAQWMARIGITGMAFLGAAGAVGLTLILARGGQHTL